VQVKYADVCNILAIRHLHDLLTNLAGGWIGTGRWV